MKEDLKMDSGNNSDREGETFEDAPDSASLPPSRSSSQVPTTRSLTDRRPSSSSTTASQRHSSKVPPVPAIPHDDGASPDEELETTHEAGYTQPKSPLLTSHRISTTSLDDVNLEENGNEGTLTRSRSSTQLTGPNPPVMYPPPQLPPRGSTGSPPKSQGLSGALPSVPWAPPPSAPPPLEKTLPPPAPARKLTSPFAWLSRSSSSNHVTSPPLPAASARTTRRDTASSMATISSNPELMLSRIEDGHDSDSSGHRSRGSGRNSLRDRFKLLRMREEAGITSLDQDASGQQHESGGAIAGLIGKSTNNVGLGIGNPTNVADEKEGGLAGTSAHGGHSTPPLPPVNPNLAPGTASGVSAGPSALTDPAAPVDWDLWQSVVYEGPAAVARTSADELSRAIASGIPSAIRGVVWQVLAQSKNEELESVYRDLVARGTDKEKDRSSTMSHATISAPSASSSEKANGHANGHGKEKESLASSASSVHSDLSTPATTATNGIASPHPSQERDPEVIAKLQASLLAEKKKKAKEDAAALHKLEKTIRRDLGARTSFSKYTVSAGLQDGLFGVCKAYALFDEGVGYAQGMNFLAMPLLFNMPEDEAFCLLVRLMNQYHLRDMFIQDMPGLHLHLYQFERLLEDLEPALYCHLHRRGVNPQLYATPWFLTLFAYRFPLQLVLRVYDLVLSEGLEGAILKFGVLLMQKNAQTLLGMNDMSALSTFLKERLFDVYIDQTPSAHSLLESGFFGSSGGVDKEVYRADTLVQDACAVKLTPEMLKLYTTEWEEKVRLEKEREAEVESLKSSNASLALRVRSLEERVEKFDTEHVQVASELVRTKVENEELKDQNEGLRSEVDELKAVVEKQPDEVEQKLKGEMDRIMKRNLEVHNENQALEEQMEEMEKDLVETKMQYAEINSNHEALKQKWNDLRRALGD
ncbi:MAG: hypothetical protein M1819_002099 [Sarea resinae]|nr:MAG: hypothetical protein M1819_002099 [Sarea resinae]